MLMSNDQSVTSFYGSCQIQLLGMVLSVMI
jgi:hypothetical protein